MSATDVYMHRMLKLQEKLDELGAFEFSEAKFLPQQFIDCGWGDKDTENVALFGNQLMLPRTVEKPNVIFETSGDVHYAVVAFDADAADGPYLMWVRLNVTGDLQYSPGRDVVRWQCSLPEVGDRAHRVFVFVFHQSTGEIPINGSDIIAKYSQEGRKRLSLTALMKTYRLSNIIGANCYRVLGDNDVTRQLQPQLRDKVVLDQTGRKVLAEELNGVRTEFAK